MEERDAATTLNVSLPESMRAFVEEQVRSEGYASVSEFVRMLIREHQKQLAKQRIDQLLLAGIEAGPGEVMTPAKWKAFEKKLLAKARARSRG